MLLLLCCVVGVGVDIVEIGVARVVVVAAVVCGVDVVIVAGVIIIGVSSDGCVGVRVATIVDVVDVVGDIGVVGVDCVVIVDNVCGSNVDTNDDVGVVEVYYGDD